MVVQHNMTAINANRYFGINNNKLSKSLEKLSSGYAINRAGDNAAGLAVSEKMRSQIAGINQGVKNAQDGISMVQTFEGALTETHSILQRMKTLATQSANGTYDNPVDRNAIQQEFKQLNDELDQIADTDFNGVVVLNGGVMADGMKADATGLIDYSKFEPAKGITTLVNGSGVTSATVNTVNSYQGPAVDTTVTYAYNGNGKWINTYNDQEIAANENGGFQGVFGDTIALDSSKLEAGHTIKVEYKATIPAKQDAPATADATLTIGGTGKDNTVVDMDSDSFTLGTDLKDDAMTPALAASLKKLNGATVTATLKKGETTGTMTTALTVDKIENTTIVDSTNLSTAKSAAAGITAVHNKTDGTVTFYYNAKANENLTDGIEVGTLKLADATNNDTTNDTTLAYKLAVDLPEGTTATPGVVTLKNEEAGVADKAKLLERLQKGGVSVSNTFNASEAKMSYADNITLQVGARTKDAVNFTFQYDSSAMGDLEADLNCTATGLGTDKLDLGTQSTANYAIDKIDQAINKVSMVRGTFGAIQNRLEHKIDNLNTTSENLTSAESRIRDTNMAEEMMNFTKNQILSQASQSMLAQANQLPQGVLSLLQ